MVIITKDPWEEHEMRERGGDDEKPNELEEDKGDEFSKSKKQKGRMFGFQDLASDYYQVSCAIQ